MEAYANCIALNVSDITKSYWEYLFDERELISIEFLVSFWVFFLWIFRQIYRELILGFFRIEDL